MRIVVVRDTDRDITRILTDAGEVPEVYIRDDNGTWECAVESVTERAVNTIVGRPMPELEFDNSTGRCNYCGAEVPRGVRACDTCDGPPTPKGDN